MSEHGGKKFSISIRVVQLLELYIHALSFAFLDHVATSESKDPAPYSRGHAHQFKSCQQTDGSGQNSAHQSPGHRQHGQSCGGSLRREGGEGGGSVKNDFINGKKKFQRLLIVETSNASDHY